MDNKFETEVEKLKLYDPFAQEVIKKSKDIGIEISELAADDGEQKKLQSKKLIDIQGKIEDQFIEGVQKFYNKRTEHKTTLDNKSKTYENAAHSTDQVKFDRDAVSGNFITKPFKKLWNTITKVWPAEFKEMLAKKDLISEVEKANKDINNAKEKYANKEHKYEEELSEKETKVGKKKTKYDQKGDKVGKIIRKFEEKGVNVEKSELKQGEYSKKSGQYSQQKNAIVSLKKEAKVLGNKLDSLSLDEFRKYDPKTIKQNMHKDKAKAAKEAKEASQEQKEDHPPPKPLPSAATIRNPSSSSSSSLSPSSSPSSSGKGEGPGK